MTHVHVNLREDSQSAAVAAENDTSAWFGGGGDARSVSLPGGGASGVTLSTEQTRRLQQALIAQGFAIPAGATGRYGAQTTAAVAAFQRAQGWSGSGADGIAGAETLRRLGVGGSAGGAVAVAARPRGFRP